jgi:dTMP kinase
MGKKSLFITFEGGEGAGKSTLIERVYETLSLRHLPLLKTRAPGGSKVGEAIRNILLYKQDPVSPRCELFLFLADRAEHVDEVIAPALKNGKIVLCDRFNDSTIAYQGGARGFDSAWIKKLSAFASHDLQPTLTLYLDLDPKIGFKRLQQAGLTKDRIESEDILFHQKIRASFHQIAKEEPKRFHILDASKTPDEVYSQAMREIDALF